MEILPPPTHGTNLPLDGGSSQFAGGGVSSGAFAKGVGSDEMGSGWDDSGGIDPDSDNLGGIVCIWGRVPSLTVGGVPGGWGSSWADFASGGVS